MPGTAVQWDPSRTQPPYPLHPDIEPRLDPVYRAFYNAHIFDKQQVHLQPVAASRTSGVLIPGGGAPPPVGKIQDCSIKRRETDGPAVQVRCFTPAGEAPAEGWPVAVWYHGGGWVLGNIDTENTVSANLCSRARWVVVSPDYRCVPRAAALGSADLCVGSAQSIPTLRQCRTAGRRCYGCRKRARSC